VSLKPMILAACAATMLANPASGFGQATAPAAARPSSNPFQSLWTGWSGANRDSLEAETGMQAQPDRATPDATSIPAGSPLLSRSREAAEALGARVGGIVRGGDCAEGERVARAAGDFALVQAVRDSCESRTARR
jgi:hypothetical protein